MPSALAVPSKFSKIKLHDLALSVMLVLSPALLVCAHYARGAESDDPFITFLFAMFIGILCVLTLVLSNRRAATLGTFVVLITFLVWVWLGLSGNWFRAKTEVFTLAAAGSIFLIGRTAGTSHNAFHLLWRTLVWSLIIYFTLALIGHTYNYTSDATAPGAYSTVRMHGSFISPNTLATLAGISALSAFSRVSYTLNHASSGVQTRSQLFDHVFQRATSPIILVVLCLGCLVLTSSRAGFAMFGVAFVVLIGAEYRAYRRKQLEAGRKDIRAKRYRVARWGIFGVSLIVAGFVFNSEIFAARIGEVAGDAKSRLELYDIYNAVWQEKPWFGHGLGSFNRVNDSLMTLDNVAVLHQMGAAHNVVLQWLIQQGIIGTALMGGIILAIHVPMIRALRTKSHRSKTFIRCAMCVTGFVFLHGMVDYALEIPSIMWTYTLILGVAHGRAVSLLKFEKDAMV